jgi:beta-phosphoglucomutase-like phosphatase (HAD superfamily)
VSFPVFPLVIIVDLPSSVVLANGTTRLQLDIIQSSGLPFHALFSSQLLGLTKVVPYVLFVSVNSHDYHPPLQPDPSAYIRTMDLLQLRPEDCIMVAAHAYDLRAAKNV